MKTVFVKQTRRKYRYACERIEESRGELSLANARNGNLLSCTPLSTGVCGAGRVSHGWRRVVQEGSSEDSIIGGNTEAGCQLPRGGVSDLENLLQMDGYVLHIEGHTKKGCKVRTSGRTTQERGNHMNTIS